MRVTFEATVDEIVDANIRLFFETATGRRDRAIFSVLAAVITAAGALYFFWSFWGLTLFLALPIALAAAVAGAVIFGRDYVKIARKKTRKMIVEQLGQDAPVPIAVAIEPEALVIEQLGATLRFEWERITAMDDRPEAIELRAVRPVGLMRIQARAFASMTDRATFVRLTREYLAASGRARAAA